MHRTVVIISVLLVLVKGQRFGVGVYGSVKTQFSECIENHDSLRNVWDNLEYETRKAVVEFWAKKFAALRKPIKYEKVKEFIYLLTEKSFYQNINSYKLRTQLISNIETAVLDCHENLNYNDEVTCKESNHTERRCNVPRFPDIEAPDLATVLNYMLVDWPDSLRDMISTREGRSILRSYVEDSEKALECALNLCNNNTYFFRGIIRTLWKLRAQIFFNFKNRNYPYIYHRYTLSDRVPHTCSCATTLFSSQFRAVDEFERDPPASSEDFDEILDLHVADRSGYLQDDDNFVSYQRFGMRSSESFLEKHIDQFNRIRFFFRELRTRNITIDEDDTYNGTLPYDIVPEDIQAIVYNQTVYSTYLLNLRISLEENATDTENPTFQNLVRTARPYEEDMFLLMNKPSTSGVIFTTNATTNSAASHITNAALGKTGKKDGTSVNYCGRDFINQASSTTFPESCCKCNKVNKKSKTSNVHKKSVRSCFKKRYNYVVTNSDDPVFASCSTLCSNYPHRHFYQENSPQNIKNQTSYRNINSFTPTTQSTIETVVLHRREELNYDDDVTCIETNRTELRYNVPIFPKTEDSVLATVLNLILVEWPRSLGDIISTREGRKLLRRYVEDCERALERALNFFNNNTHFFRVMIRNLWKLRAEIFYNHKNKKYPYIRHYYTLNDRDPHTCSCAATLLSSEIRAENKSERDPPASSEDFNDILNLHVADRPGYFRDDDNFASYQRFGMRSSESFFEKCVDQFYRLQFFFRALRARNIRTDEDDSYNGTLPYDRIPEDIQAIVYNQTVYSAFLLNLRISLIANTTDTENPILQNLLRTARPYEEDMFLYMTTPSTSEVITTTTSTVRTTTTNSPISSTTNATPDEKGKKGRLYINHCGRHFVNQPPSYAGFPERCCQCDEENKESDSSDSYKNSVSSCFKEEYNYSTNNSEDPVLFACSTLCSNDQNHRYYEEQRPEKIKNHDKYYGFFAGGSDDLLFDKKEQSSFLKTLQGSPDFFRATILI